MILTVFYLTPKMYFRQNSIENSFELRQQYAATKTATRPLGFVVVFVGTGMRMLRHDGAEAGSTEHQQMRR